MVADGVSLATGLKHTRTQVATKGAIVASMLRNQRSIPVQEMSHDHDMIWACLFLRVTPFFVVPEGNQQQTSHFFLGGGSPQKKDTPNLVVKFPTTPF